MYTQHKTLQVRNKFITENEIIILIIINNNLKMKQEFMIPKKFSLNNICINNNYTLKAKFVDF